MADTTNPLPNAREPFVDRYRIINPVWLRWLKPLLETLKSTSTRVDTVTAEVDTMSVTVTETATAVATLGGQWGVQIDINGKVVGLVKLDGTAAETTFTVVADKFLVKHPTTTTEIEVFVVGNILGTPTVGINGELIVDGSITADALDVTTLSAITADIGECTAGVIRSSDSKFVIDLDNKTIDIVP